ncbi:hypothetical protein H4R18_001628 [Coemansia javaensis]|uniref:Peptidase S1 domain-containing protein n=1 Tax=Coemansia javaensis TaxID=2761396 RepID=A0A9W8HF43_9FUNG|nr:hypothetical protein H4R18_001628 [Coemansia javaensis]
MRAVAALLGALAALSGSLPCAAADLHRRDVSTQYAGQPETFFPTGLLWVDGWNSMCKPVAISSTAALVAATCFEIDANKQVDVSRYTIEFAGREDRSFYAGPIKSIKVHEAFNRATFSNNIAVITFDNINIPQFESVNVAASPASWPAKKLIYRDIGQLGVWDLFSISTFAAADAAACQAASELYRSNPGDFHCSTQVTTGSAGSCPLPYKSLVAFNSDSIGQIGIYSHSAKQNVTNVCDGAAIYSFYLNIANYIPWINQQVTPGVTVATIPGLAGAPTNPAYAMAEPNFQSARGMTSYTTFGGKTVYVLFSSISKAPPAGALGQNQPPNGAPVTTVTTTTTASAQPTTTSTTTTLTVTTNVVSGVEATATAPSTVTTTTVSTASATETSTTTATQTATLTSATTVSTTSTLEVTATVFSAIGGNSVCPPVTPCLEAGGPVTVKQTQTQTATTTVTYMNFGATGVVVAGGQTQSKYVSTILVTSVKTAVTATVTVTDNRPSSTTTVTVLATGPAGSQKPTTTVVQTVTVPPESPPAPGAASSNQTLVIAVAAVAALLLVVVCVAIWVYCRGKSKPAGPATDFPYHPYATPGYVPGLSYDQHDPRPPSYPQASSYNRQEERPRWQGRRDTTGRYSGYA